MPFQSKKKRNDKMRINTSQITLTAFFVALCAIMAQISFPMPLSAVPFSFGILAVFITGALLPPIEAVTAVAVYIALGAVGMPVFSLFRGGFSVIIGPTGGFLLGYILVALTVSLLTCRLKQVTFKKVFAIMLMALIICYISGLPYFAYSTGNGFVYSVLYCAYTFLLPDMIKAALGAYLAVAIRKNIQFKK